MTSFRYNGITQPKVSFYMEYEIKHYYRVKYFSPRAKHLSQRSPKDDYERYARKIINRTYSIILNKIDEFDGTNDHLLKYYNENIEKYRKV